ncbi:hypothetical protein ACCT25_28970, partial [Rhizobium ruizarguesonis]
MLRHLDSLFSPAGRGARRADEGACEAGLSNNVHAGFGRDGIVSTCVWHLLPCAHNVLKTCSNVNFTVD